MNRKLKQWYSTIAPISTKRTTTSHPNSRKTQKTHDYDVGNSSPGLGQAQKCGEFIIQETTIQKYHLCDTRQVIICPLIYITSLKCVYRLFEICFHFAGHTAPRNFLLDPLNFLADLHFLCKIVLKPSNVIPLLLF